MYPSPSLPIPNPLSASDRRLGFGAAAGIVLLGLAYLVVGSAWLVARAGDAAAPPVFEPTEPYRGALETIVLLGAPLFVLLLAAVHASVPPERRSATLASVALAAAFAALTGANQFVRLTVGRNAGLDADSGLLLGSRWPSASLAIDFLAWGPFLGLAFLLAATAFHGGPLRSAIRASLVASGALNLASVLGPTTGDLRLCLLGTAGWIVATFACGLLAVLFARPEGSVRRLVAAAGMGAWAEDSARPTG